MSKKYVIDLPDDVQYILINGASENHCYTRMEQVDDIEELNSDYINEHYGSLQDEAYQKGFEDGKKSVSDPDRIEVGDIVERYVDGKLDSKGIYLQEDGGYWRCLFDTGAVLMTFAYPKGQFKKTGKHYDIASILEAMRA